MSPVNVTKERIEAMSKTYEQMTRPERYERLMEMINECDPDYCQPVKSVSAGLPNSTVPRSMPAPLAR